MPEWNSTGYDVSRGTRWLYAFLDCEHQLVKVGLVLTEERLSARLREVAKKHPGVHQVAASPLRGVTHQEAEHIESAVRHWMTTAHDFGHAGLVDWLTVPGEPPSDWKALLDSAVVEVLTGRSDFEEPSSISVSKDVNPLPEVDDFSADERLLARFIVGAVRSGGTMFEGRLYECLLSRILDADLPPRGVWPWDLRLRDHDDPHQRTRIEVRSGRNSVSIDGGRDAHVWIFVSKASDPSQPPLGFCVAPSYLVRTLRNSVRKPSLATIASEFGLVTADELVDAVSMIADDERRWGQQEPRSADQSREGAPQ